MAVRGSDNIVTLGDVCKLIQARDRKETGLLHAFIDQYTLAKFQETSTFHDFIEHLRGQAEELPAAFVKLMNKSRYPELVSYLSVMDVKKRLRKRGATKPAIIKKEPQTGVAPANEDAFSMESSSLCSDDEVVSPSVSSSRVATHPDEDNSDNGIARLRAENDRLVKMLTEQKMLLILLIEHATIDAGWKPFIKALVEKKM